METIIISLNEMSDKLVSFMGPMLLQSSIVIVAIAAIDFILKSKVKAAVRYGLWMLILLKLVIPPNFALPTGIGYWVPKESANLDTPAIIEYSTPINYEQEALAAELPLSAYSPTEYQSIGPVANTAQPTKTLTPLTWQSILAMVWLTFFTLGFALTCKRYRYVKNMISCSDLADSQLISLMGKYKKQLDINRNVEIRITEESQSPSVCGIFTPVILFPQNLTDKLNTVQLKAVLTHELIHIKRKDLLVNTLQAGLQLIYFFHPLLWFANARIRKIREQVVDESVMLAMGHEAEHYPTTLLEISRSIIMKPSLHLNMIEVVESKSSLIGRIKRIATMPLPKNARLGTAGLTCILIAAAILLPMAANSETANAKDIETVPVTTESAAELAQYPEVTSAELSKAEVIISEDELSEVERNLAPAAETKPTPHPSTGYNLADTAKYYTRNFARLVINPENNTFTFEGIQYNNHPKDIFKLNKLLSENKKRPDTVLEIAISTRAVNYPGNYKILEDPTFRTLIDEGIGGIKWDYWSIVGKHDSGSLGSPPEYHYSNNYVSNANYQLNLSDPQKEITCQAIRFYNNSDKPTAKLTYTLSENYHTEYLINISGTNHGNIRSSIYNALTKDPKAIRSNSGTTEHEVTFELPKQFQGGGITGEGLTIKTFDIYITKLEPNISNRSARTTGTAIDPSKPPTSMGGGMMGGGMMGGGMMGGGMMGGGMMGGGMMGGGMMGGGMMGGEALVSQPAAMPAMTDLVVPRLPETRELLATIEQNKQQKQYDPIIVEIDKKILENELALLEARRTNDVPAISLIEDKLQYLFRHKEERLDRERVQQEQTAELEMKFLDMAQEIKARQENERQIRENTITNQKRIMPTTRVSDSFKDTCRILNETKLSFEFDDISLQEAIDTISQSVNVNILTFWNELELAYITPDDLVSLNLTKEVSAGKALELILKYVSTPDKPIGYTVDEEGNVFIKTVGPEHDYEFRTYYIGDLVRPMYTPTYGQNQSGNNNNNRNGNNNNNNRGNSNNNRGSGTMGGGGRSGGSIGR